MSPPHPDATVLERLRCREIDCERLGQDARRWKRLATGLFGLLSVGLLGAAAATSRTTLEANEFVLRDDQGRMRAALAIRPDGTPGLGFFDEHGRVRLSCELGPRGVPGVQLLDDTGALRAAMAIRPDETPGLGLFGPNGGIRASMDVGPDGTSGVNIYDVSGALRTAIAIRPDGTPGVGIFDELGQEVSAIVDQNSPRRQEPAPH